MHATSLISRILVSSSEIILDNFKDKIEALQLKMNQVVEAKVTKVLPNGKVRLAVKGQTIVAKTHVLLTEGETIKLQAVSDGDSKVLKLITKNSQPFVPEGLKEMRAFGRSGLFSKLTSVLSEYLPPSEKLPPTPKEFKSNDLTATLKDALPDVKQQKSAPGNLIINKTNVVGDVKAFDVANLKLLLDNKNIPWPQKAAALLIQPEAKNSILPQKMIGQLAEKLVFSLVKETSPGTQKPVLEQLGEISQKMRTSLSVQDNAAIDNVIKDKSIPWEYKLLTVLSSDKNRIQKADLVPVQKILLQGLNQSGFNITGDSLSENILVMEEGALKSKSIHVAKKLENLLDLLSLKPDVEPDNESLKAIVKNSGLMWESKLRSVVESLKAQITSRDAEALINNDIKALAMKLAMVLEGEDKNIGKTLRSFVDGLEKMQLLNTHSSDESGRYLLPLPFFLNDTVKFGQLLIDLDRDAKPENKGNDKAIRVAFILELTRLGHLKADFSIYKKSISGEFGVENREIQALFHQLIPGLKEKLEDKDYHIKKIGCSVISSGELAVTSLTDMVIDNPNGVLNIVV